MRVVKELIYPLYITLLWLRYSQGVPLPEVYRRVYALIKSGHIPRAVAQAAIQAGVDSLGPKIPDEEIERHLMASISNPPAPDHEGNILDLVIALLGLPFPRNAISRDALKALGKALLDPSEIAQVKALIDKQEKFCGVCGRDIDFYEMVSFNEDRVLLCSKCQAPSYCRCGCGQRVPIKDMYTAKKNPCKDHDEVKEEKTAPVRFGGLRAVAAPPPRVAEPAQRRRNDILRDFLVQAQNQPIQVAWDLEAPQPAPPEADHYIAYNILGNRDDEAGRNNGER